MKKILVIVLLIAVMFNLAACASESQRVAYSLDSYKIYAELSLDDMSIDCRQIVDYTNKSEDVLEDLYFTLSANGYRKDAKYSAIATEEIFRAYPNGLSYGNITVDTVRISDSKCDFKIGGEDENVLIVEFREPLYPDESVQVEMEYTVKLANVKHRLGYTDDAINIGNWYPAICVYEDFEYKNYPYYSCGDPFFYEMANYYVEFTLPSTHVVAHSGNAVKKVEKDGLATYTFEQNSIRDFAMCVSDKFKTVSAKQNGVEIKYYYIGDTEYADSLKIAKDCFAYFSNEFGKYDYKSLSVVQTDFLQGGMEFSNLVYISSDLSKSAHKQVIVHEIAHEWWYMIVGNNQVEQAWLDEGLTDFSTSLYYKHDGDESLMRSGESSYKGYLRLFTAMNSKIDTNMERSLGEYTSTSEYVAMAYSKGQMLFANLYNDVGDKAFFNGIRRYFEDNKYKVANKDKFISSFSMGAKRELEGYINSFMHARIFV